MESGAIDLVSVGHGASIGGKVTFANAEVIGDELVIGTIAVGDEASIGTSCVIGHDVVIGAGAEVLDLTAVPPGARLGDWEIWDGSPARKVGLVDRAALPAEATAGRTTRTLQAIVYAAVLLLMPPVSLLPIFPAFYLFDRIDDTISSVFDVSYIYYLPVLAWPTAMALIAATVLLVVALRWTVLPRVKAGTHSVHSWFYLRRWVVGLATEVTLESLSSLYATVYMRNWYRLMGAKIGKDAEISSISRGATTSWRSARSASSRTR